MIVTNSDGQSFEFQMWEDVRADCKYPKKDNNNGFIVYNNIVYTIRIKGNSFKPKVFNNNTYTLKVGEQGTKKMKTLKNTIFNLLIFSVVIQSFGQVNIPDFSERFENYIEKNKGESVYLQTDREVYYGGDRLNFKAFIRDIYTLEANSESKNLHLIIVDPFGNIQQEKIFEVVSNQATGNIDILNGMPSGEYKLIAWTNEMESHRWFCRYNA